MLFGRHRRRALGCVAARVVAIGRGRATGFAKVGLKEDGGPVQLRKLGLAAELKEGEHMHAHMDGKVRL